MPEDESSKTKQEVMEALTQAQLPPLGTAMYDGVWEWVYELVTKAEKVKLMMGSDHISKPQHDSKPTCISQEATKVPQDAVDTPDMDTTSHECFMESPSLKPASVSSSVPLSSELSTTDHQSPGGSVQQARIFDKSPSPQSKTSSESSSSEHDYTPLKHASTRSQLLHQCLYGVAVCAIRCPTYFKPLYRLSSALLKLGLPKVVTVTYYSFC